MSAIYYYKRKTNPIKWIIIILIILVVSVFLYWFYTNYFSKIDVSKSDSNNLNSNQIHEISQNLLLNLSLAEGDVQMAIKKEDYITALKNTILHQGDKIKVGSNSRAVLNLENGSIIRLGENTEIVLQNTEDKNFLIEVLDGRVYFNLSENANYQVKALDVVTTALGTKFEVMATADTSYVTVSTIERSVKVEVLDKGNNFILGSRLDANEKATINLKASKNEIMKIETFTATSLAKQSWYKWNFDLDKGLNATMIDAPKFEAISDSLQLSTTLKDNGIYLSWSAYTGTDFKNYQIVRSDTNPKLKYPDDSVIKTSDSKDLNSYLDTLTQSDKNYYYRICVLKTNDNVACGTISNIQSQTSVKDTTPPMAPVLNATISESGVKLIWSKNQDSDFKEYVILRSAYNFSPAYPADKIATTKIGFENYLDKEVNITSVGAYYYRICNIDLSDNFNCSNVASVIDGKVQ
jgi:hypothetical protein